MASSATLPAPRLTGPELIDALVAGRYHDPGTGAPVSVACRSVIMADRLAGSEAEIIQHLGLGRRLAVISDPHTGAALGRRIERALAGVAEIEAVHLPAHPRADMDTVLRLEARCERVDALIAVGSGTINDLCKYTAARLGRPYAVFGTAPSMNGYTSTNATITVDRHKRTMPARAPAGVFFDLQVLAAAPARLIRAGLGDSICRATAQADWLLSHMLCDTPYQRLPFDLLTGEEDALLAEPEALVAGDLAAVARLARTLVLSGFGMTISGGSNPASQGEHLISHYLDMVAGAALPHVYHGERIGVTTLTMAALQERMLGSRRPVPAPSRERETGFIVHFGAALGRSCWQEFRPKRLDAEQARQRDRRLRRDWDSIRAQIARVTRPARQLRHVLDKAGCPTRPEHLGWSRSLYRCAVENGRKIRNRFTFLDLAADAGVLGESLDRLMI